MAPIGTEAILPMPTDAPDTASIDERSAFLRTLEDRDDIISTDASRDGFQVIYIEVAETVGFHNTLQEQAHRLGYNIEPLCGSVYRLSQWWTQLPIQPASHAIQFQRQPAPAPDRHRQSIHLFHFLVLTALGAFTPYRIW